MEHHDLENACFRSEVGELEIPILLGPLERELLKRCVLLNIGRWTKSKDPIIKSVIIRTLCMRPTTRSIVTEIHLSWISGAILVSTVLMTYEGTQLHSQRNGQV
jgi:hypothetical protein